MSTGENGEFEGKRVGLRYQIARDGLPNRNAAPVGEQDRRVLIQARSRFNGAVRGVPPLHDHIGPKGEVACLLLRPTPAGDSHIQLDLAVR